MNISGSQAEIVRFLGFTIVAEGINKDCLYLKTNVCFEDKLFDNLQQISRLFNTTCINFNTEANAWEIKF